MGRRSRHRLPRRDRPNSTPFRVAVRSQAAVDRLNNVSVQIHSAACVEFEPDAGLWTLARYADNAAQATWRGPLEACFRLLAESGFGGHRRQGWGTTEAPECRQGTWPNLLFPKLARAVRDNEDSSGAPLFWLLSLFSPSPQDTVDWNAGDYRLTLRGGRVESLAAATTSLKKSVRMVAEGSVLSAREEPTGAALDVAPDNFAHPVYRSGFAIALKLPTIRVASDFAPVETPTDEESLDPRPSEVPAAATPLEAPPTAAPEPAPAEPEPKPTTPEPAPDEPVASGPAAAEEPSTAAPASSSEESSSEESSSAETPSAEPATPEEALETTPTEGQPDEL